MAPDREGVGLHRGGLTIRRLAWLLVVGTGAAQANHPMFTEDTQVLGKDRMQVELHGLRAKDGAARRDEGSVTLSRGVHDKADLQLDVPYLRQRADDASVSGIGDTTVSAKWRVYEAGAFSALVRPDVIAPTGDDSKGLGTGRWRWALNGIAAWEIGPVELIGHVGYLDNRNTLGERRALRHASLALLWTPVHSLTLLVDYARDTNRDPADDRASREVVYGLMYAWSKDVDLGIGLQRGLSEPADDRALRAGLKIRW